MYTLDGRFASALLTIDNLDSGAISQLYGLLNARSSEGSHIAIMPDGHEGGACLVGFTQRFTDGAETRIVPNFVGGDIACGIFAWPIGKDAPDLNRLDAFLRAKYLHRATREDSVSNFVNGNDKAYFEEADARLIKKERSVFGSEPDHIPAIQQLGTLGGGNHFISLERSEKSGEIYLIIHTGSRLFGKSVCKLFQKMAANAHATGCPQGLEYLSPADDGYESYLDFMDIGIEFAKRNKEIIAAEILDYLRLEAHDGAVKTNHNYFDRRARTIRKGAVSAMAGETYLCPINMRDGTFICVGKGNPEWNCSAPHGAGRLMSRGDAKSVLDIEEVKRNLGDLYTTTIETSIDEAPDAYKSLEFIREHITPTGEIVDHLKPIYNFKG
ncbi:MAG: RtcB family protein [Kiritimatiellae bacterium]|nr:RtcB family protein [Kiritimatiellia bacterium]